MEKGELRNPFLHFKTYKNTSHFCIIRDNQSCWLRKPTLKVPFNKKAISIMKKIVPIIKDPTKQQLI